MIGFDCQPCHRRSRRHRWLAGAALTALTPATNGQYSFHGLRFISNSSNNNVNAISGNGLVATGGTLVSGLGPDPAFRWMNNKIEPLPMPNGFDVGWGRELSQDGSTIVGTVRSTTTQAESAVRWRTSGNVLVLGNPPGSQSSVGWDVSGDGQVLVANGLSNLGYGSATPYRWSESTGWSPMPPTPYNMGKDVRAISADGSVLAGGMDTPEGFRAYVWSEARGYENLGVLPGGGDVVAWAISSDGSTVVGQGHNQSGSGFVPFRWTRADGMHTIPAAPYGTYGVSGDGSVVGGGIFSLSPTGPSAAWIWTASAGTQKLSELLKSLGAGGLEGWKLDAVTGISDDGRTLVGRGFNPAGQRECWIAVVPSPSSIAVPLAATALAFRRLRPGPARFIA